MDQPQGSSADVLIVEDDTFLSNLLMTKFKGKGLDAVPAYNGQEALDILKTRKPHLILLDIIMPVMNGYQFLTEVKKNPDTKDIPVIVLSNLGQPEEIARAKSLGALYVLVKADFSPAEIYETVKSNLPHA